MYMCYLFFRLCLEMHCRHALHFCMYFLQMEDFWCWTVPLSSQEVDAGTLLLSDLLTLFRSHHLSHWCPLQQKKKIFLAQCSGAIVPCVWCGFVLFLFSNRREFIWVLLFQRVRVHGPHGRQYSSWQAGREQQLRVHILILKHEADCGVFLEKFLGCPCLGSHDIFFFF